MRFSTYPRLEPRQREHSKYRIVAAERALQRAREKHPMFADQFVTETVDDRLTRQDAARTTWQEQARHRQACLWHRARSKLFSLDAEQRKAIVEEWNNHRWLPGSPEYLLELIRARTPKV